MPREGGFSLLEVLISSTVLTTALLGLAMLMMRGMEDAAASRYELAAAILFRDLAGRQQLAGETLETPDPGSFAGLEVEQWRSLVQDHLPGGEVAICRDGTPDDGRPGNPECDGSGPLVAKLFWALPPVLAPQRSSRALAR